MRLFAAASAFLRAASTFLRTSSARLAAASALAVAVIVLELAFGPPLAVEARRLLVEEVEVVVALRAAGTSS